MNIPKFDPEVLAKTFSIMQLATSLPAQEKLLDAFNDLISETRENIISGGKSPDELNALLDRLTILIVKKQYTETRVAALKHMHAIHDERESSSEIQLVEDNRTLKEILEEG